MNDSPRPDGDDFPAIATDVASLSLEDGGFVVYDPGEEDAWLQTDAPVVLADWQ